MLNPFLAGRTLKAAGLVAAFDNTLQIKYQQADQTRNNNTAYLDSTWLVFPLAANTSYFLLSWLVVDTNSTADVKIKFSLPTSGFARMSKMGFDVGAAAVSGSINLQAFDDTVGDVVEFTYGGVASGTMLTAFPMGVIAIGATAGNLTLSFAQNTANVSNTILKQTSTIALIRLL